MRHMRKLSLSLRMRHMHKPSFAEPERGGVSYARAPRAATEPALRDLIARSNKLEKFLPIPGAEYSAWYILVLKVVVREKLLRLSADGNPTGSHPGQFVKTRVSDFPRLFCPTAVRTLLLVMSEPKSEKRRQHRRQSSL
jgi:hypothetical protein